MKPGRATGFLAFAMSCLAVLTVLASSAMAQDKDPFIVETADFSLDKELLMLDMVVESEIPDYISIALEQGFAVPIMFEVEIHSEKRYWFDDRIVSLKQQYLLHHLPMLDSFVVFDVNNSERYYFDNRKAAVRYLEVVYNYPMLNINNLAADKEYYARVRFGIDTDELPSPLKSSSLWDNDWDLQSEWYEWEVRRPR
ncbi:MAG: DUF4390 domain-containing protein [Gammaproteobacteria bacterium]|nr:DUF4390 domain-containing protein [Gammaproteobacteria bacterium]